MIRCEKCNSTLVNCYQLINSYDWHCFCNKCFHKWTVKNDEIDD